jgi:hypothetical protein
MPLWGEEKRMKMRETKEEETRYERDTEWRLARRC